MNALRRLRAWFLALTYPLLPWLLAINLALLTACTLLYLTTGHLVTPLAITALFGTVIGANAVRNRRDRGGVR